VPSRVSGWGEEGLSCVGIDTPGDPGAVGSECWGFWNKNSYWNLPRLGGGLKGGGRERDPAFSDFRSDGGSLLQFPTSRWGGILLNRQWREKKEVMKCVSFLGEGSVKHKEAGPKADYPENLYPCGRLTQVTGPNTVGKIFPAARKACGKRRRGSMD